MTYIAIWLWLCGMVLAYTIMYEALAPSRTVYQVFFRVLAALLWPIMVMAALIIFPVKKWREVRRP